MQTGKFLIRMAIHYRMESSSCCLGGGLCQMSSFLYWLFMHTPLTVTEQHTHGIDLHRNTPGIPQEIDAAVAEGRLDLKVKNNTAYTFQIQISVDKYHMRGKVLSDAKLRTAAG